MSYSLLSKLYPIINLETCPKPLELLEICSKSNVELIQIRGKSLSNKDFIDFSKSSKKIIRQNNSSSKLIINDNLETCLEVSADGIHLGQEDLDIEYVRNILGPEKIIGFSTHNLNQVVSAQNNSADYLGFGPIFNTSSKANSDPITGVDALAETIKLSRKPIVAIGGITLENAQQVLSTGASSVAIIGDLEKKIYSCDFTFEKYFEKIKNF